MSAEERLAICKKCPLCRITDMGLKCDDRKWISKDGSQASFFKKDGWVRGCGCYLIQKTKNPNNHCIINLW